MGGVTFLSPGILSPVLRVAQLSDTFTRPFIRPSLFYSFGHRHVHRWTRTRTVGGGPGVALVLGKPHKIHYSGRMNDVCHSNVAWMGHYLLCGVLWHGGHARWNCTVNPDIHPDTCVWRRNLFGGREAEEEEDETGNCQMGARCRKRDQGTATVLTEWTVDTRGRHFQGFTVIISRDFGEKSFYQAHAFDFVFTNFFNF